MTLTPQFLDELRARTTLSALVGKSVKLQRAGHEFKACCPFHNEKSPSFTLNDDKGFYHCFGCGAHGDAIKWLTEHQGLPFMDAVKELAAAAGMEVPAADSRSAQRAERAKGLHEVCADAAAWFTEQLHGLAGSEARALLERRGITNETTREFGLGFAPDSRGKLRAALRDYGDALLVEAGLLIQVDGKEPYDRFRGRLMIPIRDPRGRVIAFGGRIIGDGEPKYLNSPETPLFDKGRQLYNLDRASAASRKAGRVIAVEGYMDVIALAQAGFGEAVAPLGTAMTEAQLDRLWRLSQIPTLCFDGDAAGQKAAVRAAHRALPLLQPGFSLSIVTLPSALDPDDVVRGGGKRAFEKVLARARSLSDFLWRSELATLPADPGPDERAALLYRLQQLAETINDRLIQSQYRDEFRSRFYGVFGSRAQRMSAVSDIVRQAAPATTKSLVLAFYRAILLGLMRYPQVLRAHTEEISRLPIVNSYLRKWRDHLIDMTFWSDGDLTESVIVQALHELHKFSFEKRNYSEDLAFSFYFVSTDGAEDELVQVIDVLNDEYKTRQAAALAEAHFRDEMTDEVFERQQAARRAASAARDRVGEWLERMRQAA